MNTIDSVMITCISKMNSILVCCRSDNIQDWPNSKSTFQSEENFYAHRVALFSNEIHLVYDDRLDRVIKISRLIISRKEVLLVRTQFGYYFSVIRCSSSWKLYSLNILKYIVLFCYN